jgi:hypothetical protein
VPKKSLSPGSKEIFGIINLTTEIKQWLKKLCPKNYIYDISIFVIKLKNLVNKKIILIVRNNSRTKFLDFSMV